MAEEHSGGASHEKRKKIGSPHIAAPLLVLVVLVAMHLSRYLLADAATGGELLLSISVVQIVVLALPCMLYYLLRGRKLASPMPVSPIGLRHITLIVFAALVFLSGSLLIRFGYQTLASQSVNTAGFFDGLYSGEEEPSLAGMLLSFVIIPAVCEEVLFRGILFAEYSSLGEANAVLISAICFAMLHFSLTNFPVYLFAGILLGVVTAVSRSVIPAVLLHLFSNTLSVFTSDRFLRIILQKNGAFFVGFLLVVLFGAALFLLLYSIEHLYLHYAVRPPDGSLPPKSRSNAVKVFLSPTFLLLIAAFLVILALQ